RAMMGCLSGFPGEIGDAYLSRCGFGCGSGGDARPAGEHAGSRAGLLLLFNRRPAVGVSARLFGPKLCPPLLEATRPFGLPLPLGSLPTLALRPGRQAKKEVRAAPAPRSCSQHLITPYFAASG